ncbi:MAG: 23S rRNA (guanosine(2251)-2'-O)-methyltransferase RlmB [Deltaproteobacteria bacterium]|nr:23S rRNA (guanosine(2251)-2'-O)-methyltransferase RlmB [Deltaproteobacteria bacterium]MBI3296456.1 23S rRNA (guanosine(2251)-2'-O)-methyltransferase RlmB [Deltaproteobacteria bacterium]
MALINGTSLEVTSLSAIAHILEHAPERGVALSIMESGPARVQSLVSLAKEKGVEIRPMRSGEPVLKVKPFEFKDWDFIEALSTEKTGMVVVLDHIQDPQNFGAIVRSAEAFGVKAVIIPKDRSVTVTPAVYTASAGAVETLAIVQVTNVSDRIARLKKDGFWIVGAHKGEKATDPWKIPTFEKIALVMGTEFEGLRPSVIAACDWISAIPMKGQIESLNVSAACAVLLYELNARRGAN